MYPRNRSRFAPPSAYSAASDCAVCPPWYLRAPSAIEPSIRSNPSRRKNSSSAEDSRSGFLANPLAIMDGARGLAKNPERLSSALELFFRLEGLERMLGSIAEGARKYQGGQTAQSLAALYAEGGANRERFRGYMINLSVEREHQFEVMDKEAQRCRATLMAPAPPKITGRKK